MLSTPAADTSTFSSSSKPTKICGHDVFFPDGKVPFSSQKSVISKALIALNKGQNALLESPTGTGKTLALLTSTLSWQKKNYEQAQARFLQQQEKKEAEKEARGCKQEGGDQGSSSIGSPSGALGSDGDLPTPVSSITGVIDAAAIKEEVSVAIGPGVVIAESPVPTAVPRRKQIYFCARTHSQLQQVGALTITAFVIFMALCAVIRFIYA
jgi:Fanconi anemia group J protein